MEFRGFVYKNNLNALSQYDNITFYPELFTQQQEIGEAIFNFFNTEIRDKLQHIESYVIDFFVDVDKIYVIELNPFHTGAGPCLFTWRGIFFLFAFFLYFKILMALYKKKIENYS